MHRIALLLLCAAPAFGVCSDWSTTPERNAPFGIVADMNGDGRPDVVTSGVGIKIHYGGDFERVVELQSGYLHSAIAIADFDHDGHLDIAAGQPTGGADVLMLFRAAAVYEFRQLGDLHPSGMQAVDLDGDGVPDLVSISGNDVLTAMNDGHGNFRAPQRTGVEAGGTLLATGDFDGDHKGDVAVLGPGTDNFLRVYRGDGRGGLQLVPSPELNGPVAITAADLDRDGKTELLVGTADRVVTLRSTGSGFTRTAELQPSGTPAQIAVADVDHDGTPDVLVAATKGVSVWRNEGGTAMSFRRAPDVASVLFATGIAVADLDGDGLTDVLLGPSGVVRFGRGNGTFTTYRKSLGMDVRLAAAGDIDGDGDTDVVADVLSYFGGGSIVIDNLIVLRNVSGTLVAEEKALGFGNMYDLELADLDGDGLPEIIVSGQVTAGNVVYVLRTGPGKPEIVASFPAASRSVFAAGDFDGDGRKELAFALTADTGRIVKAASLDSFKVAGEFPLPAGSNPDAAADFDGDGRDDLVLLRKASAPDGRADVLYSKGDGAFEQPFELRKNTTIFGVLIGDFDGDGRPDIALDDQEVFIAYAAGRTFDVRQLDSRSGVMRGIVLASAVDLDGDGRAEILATGESLVKTFYLGGRGAPLRRVDVLAAAGLTYPSPALTVDLSGTGRLDLLTRSELFTARCSPFGEHRRPR